MTDPAIARCHREIAEAQAALLSGAPDEDELLVWHSDWQCELSLIKKEQMRKRICTASLFLLFAGILSSVFLIHVPDTCWWWRGYHSSQEPELLLGWLIGNIMIPLVAVGFATGAARLVWYWASLCCGKLRGER